MLSRSVRRTSIGRELSRLVVLAVAIATLLGAGAAAWRDAQQRLAAKSDILVGIAETLGATASGAVRARDQRSIAVALNSARSFPFVKYVLAADTEGNRLYEFGSGIMVDDGRRGLDEGRELSVWTSLRQGTMLIARPVVNGGEVVGQIVIIADVSELRNSLLLSARDALLVGLVAALIAVVGSRRLQASITRPILELAQVATHIKSTGDYAQTLQKTADNEVGALVDDFNHMMREVRHRDEQIRSHRDQLVDEVARQTRELVDARNAADKANAAKSEFLATMSHEIRTPLNGLLVTAELLAEEASTRAVKRHCDVILGSGRTLLSLINNILDLSKIEAGKMEMEAVAFDPVELVEDVLLVFADRAAKSGLDIACVVEEGVPAQVRLDPLRLRQILSNLVGNALKFTATGGVQVKVSLSKSGAAQPRLSIAVRDTGMGIEPDKLALLFKPFTQADASIASQYGGTGIGLAICHRLAAAMGGQIKVESTCGVGSMFEVQLPAGVPSLVPRASPKIAGKKYAVSHGLPIMAEAAHALAARLGLEEASVTSLTSSDILFLGAAPSDEQLEWPRQQSAPGVILLPGAKRPKQCPRDCRVLALQAPFGGERSARDVAKFCNEPLSDDNHERKQAVRDRPSYVGIKVLAADDNLVNREILEAALARYGILTTSVENGAKAFEAAKSSNFDLIFLDGSMPVMDGYEAARELRKWEIENRRNPIPIIALTANVLGQKAEAWRDAGMSEHLAKPFTLADLDRCLARWLENRPTARQHEAAPPVQESAGDPPNLIDESVLASIAALQTPGLDLLQRVVRIYVDQTPGLLDALKASLGGESRAIASAAHALKSLSSNIGAVRVSAMCEYIEDHAARGERITVSDVLELEERLARTRALLQDRFEDRDMSSVDPTQARQHV